MQCTKIPSLKLFKGGVGELMDLPPLITAWCFEKIYTINGLKGDGIGRRWVNFLKNFNLVSCVEMSIRAHEDMP